MSTPLDAAAAALGLSPWILPLIAIAAKRKEAAGPRRILLPWWRGKRNPRASAARARPALRSASASGRAPKP